MNPLIGITRIKSYQSFNVILIINTKFNEARDVIDVSTYIFVNNNEAQGEVNAIANTGV